MLIMTISEFINRTRNNPNDIPNRLQGQLHGDVRENDENSEYQSWVNSYQELASVLDHCNQVIKNMRVILEYNFRRTPFRCDAMLAGQKEGIDKLLIIELKQWERGNVGYADNENVIAYGIRKEHPVVQVRGYESMFQNYSAVSEGNVTVDSCVFLHNYDFVDPVGNDVLYHNDDMEHIDYRNHMVRDDGSHIKMFGSHDYDGLRDYIDESFDAISETVVDQIENSIVNLEAFIDRIQNILEGRAVFRPTEEQNRVLGNILDNLNQDENEHRVFVVKGGPGTGKTVLAINTLVKLGSNITCGGLGYQHVKYVTKNAQLLNSFLSEMGHGEELLPAYNNRTIRAIFSQVNPVIGDNEAYDCLIVDESQRLPQSYKENENWSHNILNRLINKSKNIIFLLDDEQKLAFNDVLFMDQINDAVNEEHVSVMPDFNDEGQKADYTLYQAFRTFGSREHLNWIDRFLGYEYAQNLECALADGYDIRVVRSPRELFYMVHDKETNGERARVMAGLCWQWKDEHKNDKRYADVRIVDNAGEYNYSWNRQSIHNWAVNDDTIDEIGCVHTVLGQEFDYAGVIIGKDLVFQNGEVIPDPDNNTQFMRYRNGNVTKRVNGMPISLNDRQNIIRLSDSIDGDRFAEAKELVRNHYHILLTRGRKGCYIYCEDSELQRHLCEIIGQDEPVEYRPECELEDAIWVEDEQ